MAPSYFDSDRIPAEIYDQIFALVDVKDRASMMLVSKHMNKACRMRHWAEVRFRAEIQWKLNQLLDELNQSVWVKQRHDMEHPRNRPVFSEYIKGAEIVLKDPVVPQSLEYDEGTFLHPDDRHWPRFKTCMDFPINTLDVISQMPDLMYLKLSLSSSQVTRRQVREFRSRITGTSGNGVPKWESIKLLSIEGGDEAIAILTYLVPNLEGLQLFVTNTTTDLLFHRAAFMHGGLKRLALVLDEDEPVQVNTINPKALQRIKRCFPSLETLILHEDVARQERGTDDLDNTVIRNEDMAESEMVDFIQIVKRMRSLRRLSFQFLTDMWWNRPDTSDDDDETPYTDWYFELIEKFEPAKQLRNVAILGDYPDYFEGERATGDEPFTMLKKNAKDLPRDAWHVGIRD